MSFSGDPVVFVWLSFFSSHVGIPKKRHIQMRLAGGWGFGLVAVVSIRRDQVALEREAKPV